MKSKSKRFDPPMRRAARAALQYLDDHDLGVNVRRLRDQLEVCVWVERAKARPSMKRVGVEAAKATGFPIKAV